MTDALLFVGLLLLYPAMVLIIALTGPHNSVEIEERARAKWDRRK